MPKVQSALAGYLWQTVQAHEEAAWSFLTTTVVLEAMRALATVREEQGLSQKELAERLHTTQSAVSRTENDLEGHISLERFVKWMAACGFLPRIEAVPVVYPQAMASRWIAAGAPPWAEGNPDRVPSRDVSPFRYAQPAGEGMSQSA